MTQVFNDMSVKDSFQKFMFTELQIRGEWVRLDQSLQEAFHGRAYNPVVRELLTQTTAACVLLTGTLKFEGKLSIHARGSGPVNLLMAECTQAKTFRCLANYEDQSYDANNVSDLLGKAQLAITIDPAKGQRYQGIVPLERSTVGDCLAHYFELSEQLDTHFEFHSHNGAIYALMLQKLPDYKHLEDQDAWNRVVQLAKTLSAEEIASVDNETLTLRLYHEEQVRMFDLEPVRFECSCSFDRSLASIEALGEEEALSILDEEPVISVDCQFCHAHYEFDREAVNTLFKRGRSH